MLNHNNLHTTVWMNLKHCWIDEPYIYIYIYIYIYVYISSCSMIPFTESSCTGKTIA